MTSRTKLLVISALICAIGAVPSSDLQAAPTPVSMGTVCCPPNPEGSCEAFWDMCMYEELDWSISSNGCVWCDVI